MRKCKLMALTLIFSLLVPIYVSATDVENTTTIYMSPVGKNGNPGTKELPVGDFLGVKEAISKLSKSTDDVVVIVGGGKYCLSDGMVINEKTVGKRKLTIKAAPGEKPEFLGSRKIDISKFEPISDKNVLKNIVPSAREHIGQIDLGKQGFLREELDFTANHIVGNNCYPLKVFLNEKLESCARFPNSSYLRISNVINGGGQRRWSLNENDKGIFEVFEPNIERWGNAKNAYIEGFLGAEYMGEWAAVGDIDTDKKTITMKYWTQYGLKNKHKWSIINLLEEIDVPGEWYVDMDTLIMYYYPRYPLDVKSDTLEIATLNNTMLSIQNVENVVIDGLCFKNSNGTGIQLTGTKNVAIQNCEIKNLKSIGIELSDVTNCSVSSNDIYETGDVGIYFISGGDRNKLTPNGCVISDNHIFRTGTDSGSNWNGGIRIGANTVGTVVEHNLIHGVKNYSCSFGGNENEIRYNEIWNGNRETADSGPIYCGRSLNQYGNKISYNYIHDCVNITSNQYGNHICNTGDDWQSGTIIENNIIDVGKKSNTTGTGTHSRDNIIKYNTVICAGAGLNLGDRYKYIPNMLDTSNGTTEGLLASLKSGTGLKVGFAETAVWKSKYPEISTTYDDIVANNGRFMVRNNLITDNVCVDAPVKVEDDIYYKISTVERNLDIDDYGVFVDSDNHDFRIKSEAMKKYNLDEHIINEDNFSMDQIGIRENVKQIAKPNDEFRKTYPENGAKNLQRENLQIVWERAKFADQYRYVVAKNSELTDVVAQGVTFENSVVLEDLENGTNYYWSVEAENISKQIGNTWSSKGDVSLFKTSKYDNLDFDALDSTIAQANEILDTIEEGENIGDFAKGTINNFKADIEEAQKVTKITHGSTQTVNDATEKLKKCISAINGYRIAGYGTIDTELSNWQCTSQNEFSQNNEDGSLVFNGKSVIAAFSKKIPSYQMLKFKVKSEYSPWFGIAARQKNKEEMAFSQSGNSYLVIIKPDIFELQKYNPTAEKTGILKTAPNNGIIAENQWCDIEFGAINVRDGVEIKLAVNGNVIFDYFDNENPNYEMGYFTLTPSYNTGNTYIKGADNVPTDVFVTNENIFNKVIERESTYYTTEDSIYSESGTFIQSDISGYDSKPIKISSSGVAQWNTQIPMADYRMYYYHVPLVNGDKNAKVAFETLGGIAGSFTFEKNVDFSTGEAGWREIGTFTPSSPDAKAGVLQIRISGSGTGDIPVSAIRIDKAIDGEIDFSKFFYETNQKLMVMKIGKTSYFNNIEKYEMDVSPEIVSNRTLVPLRTVTEGFGFTVEWNEENKTITLSDDEYNIVFAVNRNEFTVNGIKKASDVSPIISNGRTLIPLRTLAEAINKNVYWDEANKMILIGDKVSISDSNNSSYSGILGTVSDWFEK